MLTIHHSKTGVLPGIVNERVGISSSLSKGNCLLGANRIFWTNRLTFGCHDSCFIQTVLTFFALSEVSAGFLVYTLILCKYLGLF